MTLRNDTQPGLPTQPNIIFILIDDLGCRDLGCYGSTFYETPVLDRLAMEGMRFTNAYASCPVCSPTRASILSGKYPARVGITQWIGGNASGKLKDVPYLHYLPLTETTVATALREGGYQTWHVGKWHLGDAPFYPDRQGFDVNLGGCDRGMPTGPNFHFSPYNLPTLPDGPPGEYLTDRLTDEAIRLMKGRDRSRPFFLNFWHYAVHIPIRAPEPLIEKYRRKAVAMKLDQVPAIVEGEELAKLPPPGQPPQHIRRRMIQSDPAYAAMVEALDTSIGRLLSALEQEGLAENTIIVFTSDNGGLATAESSPTSNLPYIEGKGWNYEGGTRVCQIVRWPRAVPPRSICATPTTSTDYYPTLLEAAGLPPRPQQHCDGVSLMPLLRGGDQLDREAIFWHYPHYSNQGGAPAASVVSGQWKLIEHFEGNRLELFDLENDPSETRNLAVQHPEIVGRLYALLHEWQKQIEAKFPEPNPDYQRLHEAALQPAVPNNAHV